MLLFSFPLNPVLLLQAIKGEKGSINASGENVLPETEHNLEESTENSTQSIQFQVVGM